MCIIDDIFIFSIIPFFYSIYLNSSLNITHVFIIFLYTLLSCLINHGTLQIRKHKFIYLFINLLISPIFIIASIFSMFYIVENFNISNNFIFELLIFIPVGIAFIYTTKFLTKYILKCCIE